MPSRPTCLFLLLFSSSRSKNWRSSVAALKNLPSQSKAAFYLANVDHGAFAGLLLDRAALFNFVHTAPRQSVVLNQASSFGKLYCASLLSNFASYQEFHHPVDILSIWCFFSRETGFELESFARLASTSWRILKKSFFVVTLSFSLHQATPFGVVFLCTFLKNCPFKCMIVGDVRGSLCTSLTHLIGDKLCQHAGELFSHFTSARV